MIEIARSELDPCARERWKATFDRRPIVSRRSTWIDPAALVLLALIGVELVLFSAGRGIASTHRRCSRSASSGR